MARITVTLVLGLTYSLLTGCNDSTFNEKVEPLAAGAPTQESRPSVPPADTYSAGPLSQPQNGAVPEAPEPEMDDQGSFAAPPAMIGGAYLVCHQTPAVYCRLDDFSKQNIEVPSHYALQFSSNASNIAFVPSPDPNWRWRLTVTLTPGVLVPLQLTLTSPRSTPLRYETLLEPRPLQVGDGTTRLQGCTTATMAAAVLAGPVWTREFTLTTAAAVAFSFKGLCGIIRANDSLLQVVDVDNRTVFTQFLPITPTALDVRYMTARLSPGTYRLVVRAGDDFDIDDLVIHSLTISPVVP